MDNMPAGLYQLRLINDAGQIVQVQSVLHTSGNATEMIHLNAGLAKGIYRLELTKPDNSKMILKVIL